MGKLQTTFLVAGTYIIFVFLLAYSYYRFSYLSKVQSKIAKEREGVYELHLEENQTQLDESVKYPGTGTEDLGLQNNEPIEEPKHGYQSGPVVNVSNTSYFVSGADRKELCDQIASKERKLDNGRVELGHIEYDMKYSYFPIQTKEGYTIGDFTVSTDSTITVPQWTSSGGASDDTKNDWRAFKNSVKAHEEGHQSILIDYAKGLTTAYNNFGYYPTAEELDSALMNSYYSLFKQMKSAQKDYDQNAEQAFSHFCNNDY
jgi:predicted secreted Zn-dependent protease